MINLPTQVWVTWLFAIWWLFVAVHDYISLASPRYRNGRALYLALVAAGQLAWLGYLLLQALVPIALVVLIAFGFTWWLWMREASAIERLFSEGASLLTQGHPEQAAERFEQVRRLAEASRSEKQRLLLYGAQGGVLFIQGRIEQAARKWEQALDLAKKYKNPRYMALYCGLLGDTYLANGLTSKAQAMLEQSLNLSRDEGLWHGEAHALRNLAEIYAETGDGQGAIKALKRAQSLYEQHNDPLGVVDQKSNQGRVYRLLCDYPRYVGCNNSEEALELARALYLEAYHFYQSWLQQHEGHWEHYLSLKVPLEIQQYRSRAANQLGSIADTYRLEGQWAKARDCYGRQLEVGRGIIFLEDLSGLALCYLELGQKSKAYDTINRAFEINERDQEQQDPRTEYLLYFRRGCLREKTGQMGKACHDYEVAMEQIDSLRRKVKREQQGVSWQRIGLLTQPERTAAARQLILLLVNRACGDKDKAGQAAFKVLERSRSQTLLEELFREQWHPGLRFEEVQLCLQNV